MTNRVLTSALVLLGFQLQTFAQNTHKIYSEKIRKNASTFHMNFSKGDFAKNGPLVNEKIYFDSENNILIGRDNFVKEISSLEDSFPGLALKDKIILVDENQAALLYATQGTQTGVFNSIPPSGKKVDFYAAEFFIMDNNALMKELLTITPLELMKDQIIGKNVVQTLEPVKLQPIKKTNMEYKRMLKDKLDAYVQNFNTRDWDAMTELFDPKAVITINKTPYKDIQALINELKTIIQKVPNATYHLVRNVAEGDRGAIGYEVNGMPSGKNATAMPGLHNVKQAIHFQFNEKGKIIDMVAVYNSADFDRQVQ